MRTWLLPLILASAAFGVEWKAMLAPGPVTAGHTETAANCDACHSAFDGIPDERCLSCHQTIAGRISSQVGWHASVADQPCISCHTDHHGADTTGTRKEASTAFDHAETGFPLVGGHSGKKCAECHEGPLSDLVSDAGCLKCHAQDDAHDSALGPACGTCHDALAWDHGLKSIADHAIAMDGGHQGKDCADCHTYGEHLSTSTTCNDCHEQGHGGTESPCSDCHQVSGFKPAEFDHGPCTCAFPGKHQTVDCLDCHEDFDFVDTPITCGGCHDPGDAHGDLGECAACHNALSWSDSQFDHNKNSAFSIEGGHLAVSCVQCHPTKGKFKGVPQVCEGCHESTAHPDFSEMSGGCAECHVTAAFAPSTFDHATTGFALEHKHGTLPCADCHAPREQPSER